MTDNVIQIKCPDHLESVSAGLTLLKMFHMTGGHNAQTITLIMEKMEIDLAKAQETTDRR